MLREGDPMQKALIALLPAVLMATPAAAQHEEKALAPRATPAPRLAMSQSPSPTVDEGTIQRISAAMLSYTALEVQGGWPTLPANAKLAPDVKGPDVVLLRRRLVITEDLAAASTSS
jgi:hypothetical protein